MKANLAKATHYTYEQETVIEEVKSSLEKPQKEISCKFFYDEKGSDLFEEIVSLEEYYPGRTEISIMQGNIDEISKLIGKKAIVVEPGSGSGKKIETVLDNLENPSAYVPIDISESYVRESALYLSEKYPHISIIPIIADYTSDFKLPDFSFEHQKLVVYYPGSTIGNFHPDEAQKFLARISTMCGKDSCLLIGVDLKKDREVLEKAYNDRKGVTARFNLNILDNLNSLIDTNFDGSKWEHRAFFNESKSRIEMHLVSLEKQLVNIGDYNVSFDKGETIHTENSYKYSVDQFCDLVSDNYSLQKHWTDREEKFAVLLFSSV